MQNLIGNQFRVILKENEKVVEGILIESDELYDYIQDENSVCIIPKVNVLYYRTNEFSHSSKVIKTIDVPTVQTAQIENKERTMIVIVDGIEVGEIKVQKNSNTNDIIRAAYSLSEVQELLEGKKQKTIECYDNSIVFVTESLEVPKTTSQVSFVMDPITSFVNPVDMAKRLNNVKGVKK